MNSIIFWNVTPYSLVEDYGRFVGTYSHHLQSLKVSEIKQPAKMQQSDLAL
jgi:hypothetical protein